MLRDSPYRSGELSTWKVSLLFTYTMALYSSTGAEYVYWKNNGLIYKNTPNYYVLTISHIKVDSLLDS